jgi:hypothetical protein
VGAAIVAFYLSTYVAHHFQSPLGWDTPGYAWRTDLARAHGVAQLPGSISVPGPVNPGRPGFVLIAAMLGSLFRAGPLPVAEVLPAVMAAAAGLAAGVFVSVVLRRPLWELLAVAFGVGTSVFLVHAINVESYQDNVIAVAVFTAAATPAVLSLRERGALIPAILLLGATGVIHWQVFEFLGAVLVLTLALYVPSSVRTWRSGTALLETPAGRLATVALGGLVVAGASILGLLTARLPSADLVAGQFADKLRRDVPQFHLPVTLAAAGLGAVSLSTAASAEDESGHKARAALAFLLAWCEVALAGWIAERLLGWAVPTHRLLANLVALPILAALAVLWLSRRAAGLWRPLGAAVVLAVLGLSAFVAHGQWFTFRPVVHISQLNDAAVAGDYLERGGIGGRPVVFVMDARTTDAFSQAWLTAHTIRAGLPPDLVARAYFYFGSPEGYLSARPTDIPTAQTDDPSVISADRYGALSAFYFQDIRNLYAKSPVALVLASSDSFYRDWVGAHPEMTVGSGAALVTGPAASGSPVGGHPFHMPGVAALVALAAGALGLLAAAGAGWAMALMGSWLLPAEVAALAPAVGAAALVLGGVVLGAARVPLAGAGGALSAIVIVASGWAVYAIRTRRRARKALHS